MSKGLFALLLLIHGTLAAIDIGLFGTWQHTINYQFFEYMKLPKEALGNLTGVMILLSILGLLFNGFFAWFFVFKKHPKNNEQQWLYKIPLSILVLGLSILMIRGGLQVAPINQSFAFFSNKPVLNYAAINSTWNAVFSLLNSQEEVDLSNFKVVEQDKLEEEFRAYFRAKVNTPQLVKSAKPNVVIILLESFTANLVGFANGPKSCTPNLDAIAQEGLAFTHAYASGNRTDKGLAAVISGFPAQANSSIITIPSKTENLPSILRALKNKDYHSTFYYGGEPEFANMKAYILNAGIDMIYSEKDYSNDFPRGKWGVSDEFTFNHLAKEMKKSESPFLKIFLTLSSHEPFDYPNSQEKGNSNEKFAASIKYTDAQIGKFWKKVKNTPNTLFVFLADHGRVAGLGDYDQLPHVNRIPIVLAGTALQDSFKGIAFKHNVNQHHLPSNLLAMLGLNSKEEPFHFQQSWMDTSQYVYLTYFNGVGLKSNYNTVLFDNESKKYHSVLRKSDSDSLGYKARLYQQKVMEAFNSY